MKYVPVLKATYLMHIPTKFVGLNATSKILLINEKSYCNV